METKVQETEQCGKKEVKKPDLGALRDQLCSVELGDDRLQDFITD